MSAPAPAPPATVRFVTARDLADSLRAGWQDFRRAPAFGLFFAAVYVAGGWLIFWALTTKGALWWTLPAAAGFPILGPFVACGLYEVSRRIEAGERLDWPGVLGVVLRQKDRQIPAMAAVVVVFFLFWNFLAHMIFALFLGLSTMTNVTSSLAVFLTREGVMMLTVGTMVGAVFAGTLYALTVVSLPMLLDREVDFVTAMITSVSVVLANPLVMGLWGAGIALSLFVAMLPWFLGLFVVLPVLGHASWHVYRRALD
ncbi:MAG: DUF2189 domain-containing protein [Paracoccaceae bacterium]|nr:MAG: DUF2189 domain-containing protein [Paracoccaceae bacterium]